MPRQRVLRGFGGPQRELFPHRETLRKGECEMKKAIMVLIITALLLGIGGAAWAKAYTNSAKHFSLVFPDGWTIKEKYMNTEVVALSPLEGAQDKFSENVNVLLEALPAGVTLEQYEKAGLENLQKSMKDFKLLGRGAETINKNPSRWILTSYDHQGATIVCLQYFLIKDRNAYVISCTANDTTMSKYKKTFETIVKSFNFTK
jgi:eukaryotic-like serine/threonine-protein kinase